VEAQISEGGGDVKARTCRDCRNPVEGARQVCDACKETLRLRANWLKRSTSGRRQEANVPEFLKTPERKKRLARYRRRAAKGKPLFD
jgi:hypothetical protein